MLSHSDVFCGIEFLSWDLLVYQLDGGSKLADPSSSFCWSYLSSWDQKEDFYKAPFFNLVLLVLAFSILYLLDQATLSAIVHLAFVCLD